MKIKIELEERVGDAVNISITHNDYQWSTIRVYSQDEINQIIKALQEFDGAKSPPAPDNVK